MQQLPETWQVRRIHVTQTQLDCQGQAREFKARVLASVSRHRIICKRSIGFYPARNSMTSRPSLYL